MALAIILALIFKEPYRDLNDHIHAEDNIATEIEDVSNYGETHDNLVKQRGKVCRLMYFI